MCVRCVCVLCLCVSVCGGDVGCKVVALPTACKENLSGAKGIKGKKDLKVSWNNTWNHDWWWEPMRWLCRAATCTERLQTHQGRGPAVMFSTFFPPAFAFQSCFLSFSPCQMDYLHISEVDVLFFGTFARHEMRAFWPEWEQDHKWEYFAENLCSTVWGSYAAPLFHVDASFVIPV